MFARKRLVKTEAVVQTCSIWKGVLRNLTKFTWNHLCQSLFFNKVVGPRPATLIKKRLWHRCLYEIFKNTFSYRTPLVTASVSKRLLLLMHELWLQNSKWEEGKQVLTTSILGKATSKFKMIEWFHEWKHDFWKMERNFRMSQRSFYILWEQLRAYSQG